MLYYSVSEKIEVIRMTLHSDLECGGRSVYLELFQEKNGKNTKLCKTRDYGDFSRGKTLDWGLWDPTELDGCYADTNNDIISFKIMSNNSDDFCPKTLKIVVKKGNSLSFEYTKIGMDDWVDNSNGNDFRIAIMTAGKMLKDSGESLGTSTHVI